MSKCSKYKIIENLYRCECGREFIKAQSLNAHFAFCLIHKQCCNLPAVIAASKIRNGKKCNLSKEYLGEEKLRKKIKKSSETRKLHYKQGLIQTIWKGRHHSYLTKQKIRESTCQYLLKIHGGPRYNKSAIPVLEQIAKEHGWKIQHAENGGEFYTGIGYFVDAYDKEKNVVLEYDEPEHYEDVENNILREKDLKRQQEIIEHLHCEYWRYNEKMKLLWKVE